MLSSHEYIVQRSQPQPTIGRKRQGVDVLTVLIIQAAGHLPGQALIQHHILVLARQGQQAAAIRMPGNTIPAGAHVVDLQQRQEKDAAWCTYEAVHWSVSGAWQGQQVPPISMFCCSSQ